MFCKIVAWGEKMATSSCCIIPHTHINFQTPLTQNLLSRIISNRWTPDTPSNDGDDWTMSARGADIAIRWVCARSFFSYETAWFQLEMRRSIAQCQFQYKPHVFIYGPGSYSRHVKSSSGSCHDSGVLRTWQVACIIHDAVFLSDNDVLNDILLQQLCCHTWDN